MSRGSWVGRVPWEEGPATAKARLQDVPEQVVGGGGMRGHPPGRAAGTRCRVVLAARGAPGVPGRLYLSQRGGWFWNGVKIGSGRDGASGARQVGVKLRERRAHALLLPSVTASSTSAAWRVDTALTAPTSLFFSLLYCQISQKAAAQRLLPSLRMCVLLFELGARMQARGPSLSCRTVPVQSTAATS